MLVSSGASAMPTTPPDVQLLQASVDSDDESEFRILVDGRSIRYLTIDPGLYDVGDMCFGPSLISMLPPLPPGDWNQGHISNDASKGRPHFSRVTKAQLPEITNIWHPRQVDYLELGMGKKLRSNVYEATCPCVDSNMIIAKFARFSWEMPQLDAEARAYQWIERQNIGPKFLGHISEEGRVIGFMIERIADCRHAAPGDVALCQQTLRRLHELGIRHGDVNRHNFLVHDGRATLIDFDMAARGADEQALEEEFRRVQEELQDTSGRGGRIVESGAA
ncbi:alpha-galactosidase A precursor [Lophiotrema nucula]|uniref:Alpha-galactosidase A n=1 Tax=Lophiotrema nucula TaxID=690887 RepID=A0A6A5YIC9_9PLEO|nr:alpha-galactosidase A precursor [Lophiotrema nucula]